MFPTPIKKLPKQNDEVIALQLSRWERSVEGNRPWSGMARVCTDFVESRQWSDADRAELTARGQPVMTFNKIARLVKIVLGVQQQNRYDLKYKPTGDASSTQATADALTKVAKQVTQANRYRWREAEVFRDGMIGGRGWFDLRMNYEKNILGEIKIDVDDPWSVYPDPHASKYDPKEWGFVTSSYWLSFNDLALFMGKKAKGMLERAGILNPNQLPLSSTFLADDEEAPLRLFGMFGNDQVDGESPMVGGYRWQMTDHLDKARKVIRLLEQQHYVTTEGNYFVDVETGDMKRIKDGTSRERVVFMLEWAQAHGNPLQVITRNEKRVRWTVTAGDILLYDDWSPYRSFTKVPFFCEFRNGSTRGMVEDLIDPQMEINKRRSAQIHIVMTTAQNGWKIHQDSVDEETKEQLEQEGSTPGLNLFWTGQSFMEPKKIEPSSPPQQMERLEMAATKDLLEISGINDSFLGQVDRVQSGRAIEARQRQTILGQEHAFSNMSLTRVLLGEKILELVQDFYTEERVIRVLGEETEPDEMMLINKREAVGAIINDVTLGQYAVVVDEVPMSATFKEAQFNEALEMAKAGLPMPPDVLVDLSSMPRKEQIKARIKLQQEMQAAGLAPPPPKSGGSSAPTPGGPGGGGVRPPAGAGRPAGPGNAGGPRPPAVPQRV